MWRNSRLYVKALSSDSQKRFDMNFQQVKPRCCDVFVWVAVWRDVIRYWVLASREVEGNRYYSSDKLYQAIRQAYHRQAAEPQAVLPDE